MEEKNEKVVVEKDYYTKQEVDAIINQKLVNLFGEMVKQKDEIKKEEVKKEEIKEDVYKW